MKFQSHNIQNSIYWIIGLTITGVISYIVLSKNELPKKIPNRLVHLNNEIRALNNPSCHTELLIGNWRLDPFVSTAPYKLTFEEKKDSILLLLDPILQKLNLEREDLKRIPSYDGYRMRSKTSRNHKCSLSNSSYFLYPINFFIDPFKNSGINYKKIKGELQKTITLKNTPSIDLNIMDNELNVLFNSLNFKSRNNKFKLKKHPLRMVTNNSTLFIHFLNKNNLVLKEVLNNNKASSIMVFYKIDKSLL